MSATTTPDNIVYPVSTDTFVLETVFAALATSIQAAFTTANTGVYTSNAQSSFTMASGWTFDEAQMTVTPQMITWRLKVTKASPTITVGATGNITNTLIATLNVAKLRPLQIVALALDGSGPVTSFYIQPDGGIYVSATTSDTNIAIGNSLSFSGTYIKAGI